MVVIGSSASAVDISRDIARSAKEVHIANRSETEQISRKQPGYDNMWLHSMVKALISGELGPCIDVHLWAIQPRVERLLILMCECRSKVPVKMALWCSKMEVQFMLMSSYIVPGTHIELYLMFQRLSRQLLEISSTK